MAVKANKADYAASPLGIEQLLSKERMSAERTQGESPVGDTGLVLPQKDFKKVVVASNRKI